VTDDRAEPMVPTNPSDHTVVVDHQCVVGADRAVSRQVHDRGQEREAVDHVEVVANERFRGHSVGHTTRYSSIEEVPQ
jgi:hypothetical protein